MKYLSDYTEENQTKLFKECGAFFAFSQEQFDEKKEDGVEYTSLPSGVIVPKKNYIILLDGINKIHEEGIKQDLEENGKKNIIWRELANYETQISNCIDDAVEALKHYNITRDEVGMEYKSYFQHCVENDLF